jgi:pyruvate/2-oxoglutarate dehydrogenase complex dihydrolipoamide dehydrogenase (E3) component
MTVDYDAVIIGGTVQARAAGAKAAMQGARVALVEPPASVDGQIRRQLTVQVLTRAAEARQHQNLWDSSSSPAPVDWAALRQRVALAEDIAYPHLSLETLASSGMDVVLEAGQFSPKPTFSFTTESRLLRGRRYLLSPPTRPTIPAISGVSTGAPVLTPETLFDLEHQPEELVILGRSPAAIALAQSLALLGTATTLMTPGCRLLPTEDSDISDFVGSLLLAAGVTLRQNTQLDSVKQEGKGKFTIQLAGENDLVTSHLLLGTSPHPQLATLNLDRASLTPPGPYLGVDDHLRTIRPGCFAFGPCLGGYWADHIDDQDGQIAIQNALYLPWRKLQQLSRVACLQTIPAFARFGFTAQQALRHFGPAVNVIQVSYDKIPCAHLDDRMTGFCRCIIHQDGSVLGAQIVGPNARELTQTVALLARQRIPIQRMAQHLSLPMAYTELLNRLSDSWQLYRWQPGHWRRDWAENWFNWRRSRVRKPS